MIHSNIKFNDFYKNIDGKIALCLAKSKELNADTPCGRYELGDECYVNVVEYSPKSAKDPIFETHDVYADVQLILSGEEYIGYNKTNLLTLVTPYDKEKDAAFWSGEVALLAMQKGDWALFMPQEAHAPSLNKCGGKVKKAIFKIKYGN